MAREFKRILIAVEDAEEAEQAIAAGSTARALIGETSRPVLAVPLVAERIPVG